MATVHNIDIALTDKDIVKAQFLPAEGSLPARIRIFDQWGSVSISIDDVHFKAIYDALPAYVEAA